MTQATPGWYPDPYGRFAQRYHDGANWTASCTDASGAQVTDPAGAGPSAGGFGPGAATGAGFQPTIGIIMTGVGALLVLCSLLFFNWGKVEGFGGELAFSLGDVNDTGGGEGLGFFPELYASILRWLAILLVIGVALAVAKVVPQINDVVKDANIWRIVGIVVAVFAAWHALSMLQTGMFSEEGVDVNTSFGAWLGLIGWGLVATPWLSTVIKEIPFDQKVGG